MLAPVLSANEQQGSMLFQHVRPAFPYSPSDLKGGEVYRFSLYHLLRVDDPRRAFPNRTDRDHRQLRRRRDRPSRGVRIMTNKLTDVASVIRSKNAGPYDRGLAPAARGLLRDGQAEVIIATRLDRMSRSVVDFASLIAAAQDEGWEIVAPDLGLDTSTTTGRMVAHILAAVAEAEGEVIGQRTSVALIAKRSRGENIGRRSVLPVHGVVRIVEARTRGG